MRRVVHVDRMSLGECNIIRTPVQAGYRRRHVCTSVGNDEEYWSCQAFFTLSRAIILLTKVGRLLSFVKFSIQLVSLVSDVTARRTHPNI